MTHPIWGNPTTAVLGWRGSDPCLLSALPDRLRPATREEGYAVQALLERHTDGPLFGWKIAATSEAGQKHINVAGPLAGRIMSDRRP